MIVTTGEHKTGSSTKDECLSDSHREKRMYRIERQVPAMEAAHIQWHQAGGPDEERNGLALCSLHHKAFDLGGFTIQPDHVVLVSEQAYGRTGFDEWLLKFHGQPIRKPQRQAYQPDERFLVWHERQVFKRPPRELMAS